MIAIISILASMLLPALSSARKKARGISCAGNLRQIGLAFQGYTMDHGGYCPPMQFKRTGSADLYDVAEGPVCWMKLFYPYLGIPKDRDQTQRYPRGKGFVLLCPSILAPVGMYQDYGYNCALFGGMFGGSGSLDFASLKKIDVIRRPSESIVMADAKVHANSGWYFIENPCVHVCYRHGRKANVLYTDGHVGSEGPSRLHLAYYWLPYFPWNYNNKATTYATGAAKGVFTGIFAPYD